MTSKQVYEATAIELSKVQAPSLKLYEFNYFFNQAIRQFVNKVYNVYDVNQQTTDDLRVLKATATLKPNPAIPSGNKAVDYLRGATYFVDMPNDYLHLLNCICLFDVNKRKDCWNEGDVMVVGATKLTADSWSSVVDDVYNRPTKKRPYYYIHNQNNIYTESGELTDRNSELPSNLQTDDYKTPVFAEEWSKLKTALEHTDNSSNTQGHLFLSDLYSLLKNEEYEWSNTFKTHCKDWIAENTHNTSLSRAQLQASLENYTLTKTQLQQRTFDYYLAEDQITDENFVEKSAGSRYANASRVKVEIRCGRDKSNVFELSAVQIDYVKAPQFIRLTQEQLDSDEDISQVLEFPDYVNQEIVNELVNLVMRKVNDPSLQTHIQMTQSIARPTGQQA